MSADVPRDPSPVGHGRKSDAIREHAVVALLSEPSIAQAAAKASVHEKTLRRWLTEDDAFQAAYAEARQTSYHAGISRVQALATEAVTTLEDLLQDTQPANVRLGAARTVLDIGTDRHDAETLAQRLDAVEAMCRETD